MREVVHDDGLTENVAEGRPERLVEMHQVDGKAGRPLRFGDQERLPVRSAREHFVEGEEGRPAPFLLAKHLDALLRDLIGLDDQGLEAVAAGGVEGGPVLRVELGEFLDRPTDPGDLAEVALRKQEIHRGELVRSAARFGAGLEARIQGQVAAVELADLSGESLRLGGKGLLAGLDRMKFLLEVSGGRVARLRPTAGLLDAEFEVLDLDRALPEVVLGLGLELLGRLEGGLGRFPALDRILPGLLLGFGLAGELELRLAGGREAVLGFPHRRGGALDLLRIRLGQRREGVEPLRKVFVLGFELRAGRVISAHRRGQLLHLLSKQFAGLGQMGEILVEARVRDLLRVELLLELQCRRPAGFGDIPVGDLHGLGEFLVPCGQLGAQGLEPLDLRASGVDLLLAAHELLFSDPVAGAREAGLGLPLVLLELLVLDGLESLAFERADVVLDLPEERLDTFEVRVQVRPLGSRPVQLIVGTG